MDPTSVVVCARRAVCGAPQAGARLQYMPEDGAGGTSGAVLGSASGGKGVKTSAPRAGAPRPVPTRGTEVEAVPLLLVVLPRPPPPPPPGVLLDPVPDDEEGVEAAPGRPAMADVERTAVGRRAVVVEEAVVLVPEFVSRLLLLLLAVAAEEAVRARAGVAAMPVGSPFSGAVICRGRVLYMCGMLVAEAEREGGGIDEDDVVGERAAADWDRWRRLSSALLLLLLWRRSWLLEERWPGVCERGIGGARSWASLTS